MCGRTCLGRNSPLSVILHRCSVSGFVDETGEHRASEEPSGAVSEKPQRAQIRTSLWRSVLGQAAVRKAVWSASQFPSGDRETTRRTRATQNRRCLSPSGRTRGAGWVDALKELPHANRVAASLWSREFHSSRSSIVMTSVHLG